MSEGELASWKMKNVFGRAIQLAVLLWSKHRWKVKERMQMKECII